MVTNARIKNKNGDPLDLDKTRVSLLMSQQNDVPTALRNAITTIGIEKRDRKSVV